MSKTRIWQMLQECLDGYEAGLTPEECLSAYNGDRAELEPLLRQALSLRVAYACTPSEEFRHQAREQLMFAAGRDVKLALTREPDPNFILQERTRFLNVAGATGQEALRDVPPPRLAFWINARRRLLDAASNTTPAPARRFGNALRYSLSAAVVAIAIGVAAVASFSGGGTPNSADAQLAALEQQIIKVEQATQQGRPISGAELDNLASLTTQITETLDDEPDLERADKIGGLILRQQEVVKQIDPDEPELAQAQEKLTDAQEKLEQFAALAATPTVAAALVEPAATENTLTPEATKEPEPTPTREPIASGEVRRTLEVDDHNSDLTWQRITTSTISFVIPDDWRLLNVETDENGILTQSNSVLGIETSGETPVIIILSQYGEAIAQINGVAVQLRGGGPEADTVAPNALVDYVGELALPMHNFVLSISVTGTP